MMVPFAKGALMRRILSKIYLLTGVALAGCLLASSGAAEAAQQDSAVKQPLPACHEAKAGGPEQVVRALYRAYPARDEKKILLDGSKQVLLGYFDEKPASLLVQIKECEKKTGDDCGPGYNLMYDSNTGEISDLRICAMDGGRNTVMVQFRDAGRPKFVEYKLTHTGGGWRIADILYAKTPGDPYSDSMVKLLTYLLSSEDSR